MLEIKNHTALSAELIPGLDKDGFDYAALIIKGRFDINPLTNSLTLSDQPAEIVKADEFYKEPDNSSVQYESDVAILKRSTDVVVNGYAYAPGGRATQQLDAGVKINDVAVTCRVFGDRYWDKSGLSWMQTPAKKFERMALLYENAYGGIDPSSEKEVVEDSRFNPVGKGYYGVKSKPVDGLPLPNIENPRSLISQHSDRPQPAGFGFINRSWQPRVQLAGCYDENWQQTRQPLLPLDFDDRFFNGAHPSLITPSFLSGGEMIALKNLNESGELNFSLPVWHAPVSVTVKGNSKRIKPLLDTVVIEPDINNVSLTWRVTMPCYKQFLYINSVTIGKKRKT